MFADWGEYRDYLLENLIDDKDFGKRRLSPRARLRNQFAKIDIKYPDTMVRNSLAKSCCQAIIQNDWHQTKISNALNHPLVAAYRHWKYKARAPLVKNTFVEDAIRNPVYVNKI